MEEQNVDNYGSMMDCKMLIIIVDGLQKNIMLNNRSQTQKSTCYMFTFMGYSITGKTTTTYGDNNQKSGCLSGVG